MKQLFAFALLVSLSLPAQAQEADETPDSLMERGAQMLLEGLLQRMEPTLDDLQGFAEEVGPALDSFLAEMGPALSGLLDQVEDWSRYHPPEILDNGDIIIRRKTPEETSPEAEPEGSIEL
ncbi:MAG: hypothetical protein HRU30_19400 [Rhodobacteraceae bacterium]|nr:hypothetical protein [Paracoccaceae bacterium]